MPTMPPVICRNIPEEICLIRQWVCWRYEDAGRGKPTKVPYTGWNVPRLTRASSTDPFTWDTFVGAMSVYRRPQLKLDGVGFIILADDEFCGIDLDRVRIDGQILPWAEQLIRDAGSYAEVSPSQTGVKILGRAKLPPNCWHRKDLADGSAIELYDHSRFWATTGNIVPGVPNVCGDINQVLARIFAKFPAVEPQAHYERAAIDLPSDRHERLERCRLYVSKMPASISGCNGHGKLYAAACKCLELFGLDEHDARTVLEEFNQRCSPRWTEREINHKIQSAKNKVGTP